MMRTHTRRTDGHLPSSASTGGMMLIVAAAGFIFGFAPVAALALGAAVGMFWNAYEEMERDAGRGGDET